MFALIEPSHARLAEYRRALEAGWSPGTEENRMAELRRIADDPADFVRLKADDRAAQGPPVRFPDGSMVDRLPGFTMWMWDGAFCGSINLRWARDKGAMPPQVRGHVGYAVVPEKRRRGYATAAIRLLLPHARAEGLPYLDFVIAPANPASIKAAVANGARLREHFRRYPGGADDPPLLLYRLDL